MFYLSKLVLNLTFIVMYYAMILMPHLFYDYQKEVQRLKYTNSKLKGVDVNLIKDRIEELMETEEVYLDEELTLAKLSGMLEISPHQLSEFLNNEMQTNFKSYVNHRRVERAKTLLVERPDDTTLSIGFRCGFNSKTVFHTAFSRLTGVSPGEYRQKNSLNTTPKKSSDI